MFCIRTVVFAIFAQHVNSFDIKTQKFYTNTNTRVVQNGALVNTMKVKSLFQCAMMCTSDINCCSSTYDKILKHCSLFLACCPSKEPSTGSQTFIKTPKPEILFSATPADCSELPPGTCSGVYTIQPKNGPTMIVFCEMDTDHGGWTTIQRRYNGSVDFYRSWNEYKTGFGYIAGEHWLGNDNIHYILRQHNSYKVRFDLEDIKRISAYAVYDTIYVGNESTNYQITITGYSGTAGDSMMDGQKNPTNGRMFSTRDRDNDIHTSLSCSIDKKSGWWHGRCTNANINGVFLLESYISANINWVPWRRGDITKTRMSVKPRI